MAGGGSLWKRVHRQPLAFKLHWLLRLGVVMEYLGHGACGLHTKAAWLPYFRLFGIPDAAAWTLMPVVGSVDITLGIAALLAPCRAVLLYMAVWGCFTAALRPAAGEGIWEFVERSYNYGIPLLFLAMYSRDNARWRWFERLRVPDLRPANCRHLLRGLRAVVVLMLIGHGGFGAFMLKKNLLGFYQSAGFGSLGLPLESVRSGIGFIEIGLGLLAIGAVDPRFFTFLFAWKFGSELLYPISGASMACWEVVERGGSYVAPLAVVCLLRYLAEPEHRTCCASGSVTRTATGAGADLT